LIKIGFFSNYFKLLYFYTVDVQNIIVNKGGTAVLKCTCEEESRWAWVRRTPQGTYITIIENGTAKNDVGDHIRIPSMQCYDLEVSNITQTDEGQYKFLCGDKNYLYKLNIKGK